MKQTVCGFDECRRPEYPCPYCSYEEIKKERDRYKDALKQIEQDTRNSSVVGSPGITCNQCEMCNDLAAEALAVLELVWPRIKNGETSVGHTVCHLSIEEKYERR